MLIGCLKNNRLNAVKFAAYVVGVCLLFLSRAWANDYKDGLTAYINDDFGVAQQHWLKAANNKDGKSMFNLGLLHEQNKLDNSNLDKALNWYRLAADNGYAPAGYHLAQRMLERGGSDDDAIILIRRAADNGYAPAMRYLGIGEVTGTRAQTGSLPKPKQAAASPKTVISEHRPDSWINRQRGQNWTIQLLAFKRQDQVEAFIKEHGLQSNAAYFSEIKEGEIFYKLVYGSYDSKDKASFARQNLAATLQQHGPWLRTWSSVHKVTKP